MGLREIAARDAQRIHEDAGGGFGWPLTLIAPDATEYPVTGFSTDIYLQIDPDTGQTVSGRAVSVSVSLKTLTDAGAVIPQGVVRKTERPWLVRILDISETEHTLKVSESYPDQALGTLILRLEAYNGA